MKLTPEELKLVICACMAYTPSNSERRAMLKSAIKKMEEEFAQQYEKDNPGSNP